MRDDQQEPQEEQAVTPGGADRRTILLVTALSLLLAVLLLLALVQVLTWAGNQRAGLAPEHWRGSDISAVRGEGRAGAGGFSLRTDAGGKAGISLRRRALQLQDFARLRVELDQAYPGRQFELLWISSGTGGQTLAHRLDGASGPDIVVNLDEVRVWRGEMTAIGLLITGAGNESLRIERVTLEPASGLDTVTRVLQDWTAFSGWAGSSINAHWGSQSLALASNPPPVLALAAGLAILLYALFVAGRGGRSTFDWRVPGAIFLACWIALDLLWQRRLLQQLAVTREMFAGKPFAEKLGAGRDAALVSFAAAIAQHLPATGARLLVGSADEARGMRTAYFLYPRNVLWQRGGPEIPPADQLRSGDYIVLAYPSAVAYDQAAGTLVAAESGPVKVQAVMGHAAGALFRVL